MKNVRLILLFISCILCSMLYAQQNEDKTIKIVTYNVWNAFEKDPKCRTNFVKWMNQQKPDVVALQEMRGFTEEMLAELAKEYGHLYTAIVRKNSHQVALTSKSPIEIINKFVGGGYWNGFLHAKTYGINFTVSHFCPYTWKQRLEEAKLITNYIKTNRLKNYVVMGDFNAHSPLDDEVLRSHTLLIENYINKEKNPQIKNMRANNSLDYSVLSHFYSEGFIDIVAQLIPAKDRMTFPSAFLKGTKIDDPNYLLTRERLDYFLISENLVPLCEKAFVHNMGDAEEISDHFPVSLIMKLPQ